MGNKNTELFKQKMDKLTTVYEAKNSDYGDSFTKSLDKYGIVASLTRMGDKFNRIDNLYDKPFSEVDESLIDSLEDLANYAIMTVLWLENQGGEEVSPEESTIHVSNKPAFTIRRYSDGYTESIINNIEDWKYIGDEDNDEVETDDIEIGTETDIFNACSVTGHEVYHCEGDDILPYRHPFDLPGKISDRFRNVMID